MMQLKDGKAIYAKVLAKLFPPYISGAQKRKFDLNDDSVVAKQHHQHHQ